MKTRIYPALLTLGLLWSAVCPASGSDSRPRAITITGNETVRIPATRARITATVENQADTTTAAQAGVQQRSKSVLEFLRQSRVEGLQAGTMTLYPVYGSPSAASTPVPDGTGEIIAYRAHWTADFEVEAGRAGEIADGLVKAGAARIGNFAFTASDEELAAAQQQALQDAALRARKNAHDILETLGYKPGHVVSVEVNSGAPAQPYFRRAEMMSLSADQASSTPVEAGLIEVSGSVVLKIAY